MSKKPFIPPLPCVDLPSQEAVDLMKNMTKKELRKFKKSDAYRECVQPVIDRRKLQRKQARKEWWKNNWIAILGLIFAFIAAIPVIIQGIASILKLLG